jgi:hypothetical protein
LPFLNLMIRSVSDEISDSNFKEYEYFVYFTLRLFLDSSVSFFLIIEFHFSHPLIHLYDLFLHNLHYSIIYSYHQIFNYKMLDYYFNHFIQFFHFKERLEVYFYSYHFQFVFSFTYFLNFID